MYLWLYFSSPGTNEKYETIFFPSSLRDSHGVTKRCFFAPNKAPSRKLNLIFQHCVKLSLQMNCCILSRKTVTDAILYSYSLIFCNHKKQKSNLIAIEPHRRYLLINSHGQTFSYYYKHRLFWFFFFSGYFK